MISPANAAAPRSTSNAGMPGVTILRYDEDHNFYGSGGPMK